MGSLPGETILPAPSLRSRPVRKILAEQIVGPVLERGWRVAAFRMNWQQHKETLNQNVWKAIVQLRTDLDSLVKKMDGILFFISAVTATQSLQTQSTSGSNVRYKIYPGVAYWLVTRDHIADALLYKHMQNNSLGAVLKLQLKHYQKTEKDICNALYLTVKDNIEGCVRRMVDGSANTLSSGPQPIVKMYAAHDEPIDIVSSAAAQLHAARFHLEIEQI